ncbi:MAG: POTRA domain-containing protein [Nostoc sp.]|uniref:POTRA domain-containing protein n=1 Tax=Nostoc sp. TaxID=1180 RepID=UPI002FF3B154
MNLSLQVRVIILTFFSLISNSHPLFAQYTPPSGVTIPPNTPGKVEQTIPQPTPSPTFSTPPFPSNPILSPNPIDNPLDTNFSTRESFFVKEIQIIGNTVLKEELTKLKQPLENQNITFEQLLELRSQITQLYINLYCSKASDWAIRKILGQRVLPTHTLLQDKA